MTSIDESFYNLTVKQRNAAWREILNLEHRIEMLTRLLRESRGWLDDGCPCDCPKCHLVQRISAALEGTS